MVALGTQKAEKLSRSRHMPGAHHLTPIESDARGLSLRLDFALGSICVA
jgi:hypothetical protein